MIETGKPFKMKPKTRKASNVLQRAAMFQDIETNEVLWQAFEAKVKRPTMILVKVVGDDFLDTIRWVQTQDDPDWEIVK